MESNSQAIVEFERKQDYVSEIVCHRFSEEGWTETVVHVPREVSLTVFINQQELVTILCTPVKLNCLVLGFLYSEGIISSMKDILMMRICEEDSTADVRLVNQDFRPPARRTLTSGCGGGVTFGAQVAKIQSSLMLTPASILTLMKQLQAHTELYKVSGGVHTSALADREKVLFVAEDLGRHNTLDKLIGECLLTGQTTHDRIILSTGRVSTEMLTKTARMQVPVIISRHSPTQNAINMAKELGITLIGYARGSRFIVYTHPERINVEK